MFLETFWERSPGENIRAGWVGRFLGDGYAIYPLGMGVYVLAVWVSYCCREDGESSSRFYDPLPTQEDIFDIMRRVVNSYSLAVMTVRYLH